jgi:hypothetical protein
LFGIAEDMLAAMHPEEKQPCKMGYVMMASFLSYFKKL